MKAFSLERFNQWAIEHGFTDAINTKWARDCDGMEVIGGMIDGCFGSISSWEIEVEGIKPDSKEVTQMTRKDRTVWLSKQFYYPGQVVQFCEITKRKMSNRGCFIQVWLKEGESKQSLTDLITLSGCKRTKPTNCIGGN